MVALFVILIISFSDSLPLILVGAVVAVAAIIYAVYRYFNAEVEEELEDDFDEDFDDDGDDLPF